MKFRLLPTSETTSTFALLHWLRTKLHSQGSRLEFNELLIHATGNPMSPAWYLLGASAIGQVALMLILESAPARSAERAG